MTTDPVSDLLVGMLAERLGPIVRAAVVEATRAALEAQAPAAASPLLSVDAAAEIAVCSAETVRRAIKRGRLPASRALGHYRIRREDLDRWLAVADADREADPIRSFANRGRR